MYANKFETKGKTKINWIIWRKIIAVIYATYAAAKKKKPEKIFFQAFFSQLHKLRI